MKISDIKNKDLRLLAEFRHLEHVKLNNTGGYNHDIRIKAAFDWRNTIEGHDFWTSVNNGKTPSSFKKLESKEMPVAVEEPSITDVLDHMRVPYYIK